MNNAVTFIDPFPWCVSLVGSSKGSCASCLVRGYGSKCSLRVDQTLSQSPLSSTNPNLIQISDSEAEPTPQSSVETATKSRRTTQIEYTGRVRLPRELSQDVEDQLYQPKNEEEILDEDLDDALGGLVDHLERDELEKREALVRALDAYRRAKEATRRAMTLYMAK